MQLTININTQDGTAEVERPEQDEWVYKPRLMDRETQRQMFGLFKVLFDTTERGLRHEFTRIVLDDDESLSWATLDQIEALQVLRALEACVAVDTMLGERYQRIMGRTA